MRLPIFALSVGTLLGTAAAAQPQAAPSASSRPQEAAITAAPLPCREEAVTFDAAPGVRLSSPLPFPARHSATAWPGATRRPRSPERAWRDPRRMGRGSSV